MIHFPNYINEPCRTDLFHHKNGIISILLLTSLERSLRIKKNNFNQSMVGGVTSRTGQNAQSNVEEEPRREAGPAVTLLQLTVVQIVREMLRKHKHAAQTPVPVSKRMLLAGDMQRDE